MTLGLLVIATAGAALLMSSGLSASVSELSQLQQQGAYALHVIGLQFRQAGSVDPVFNDLYGRYEFSRTPVTFGSTGAAVWGTAGTGTQTDSVSAASLPVRPDAVSKWTWQRNCIGNTVAMDVPVMDATFMVDAKGQLQCRSAGKVQPVIRNVADFRVRYRVDTGDGLRLLDAGAIEKSGLWASVKAIEICLELEGSEKGPDAGSEFMDCGGTTRPREGRTHLVLRNVFSLRVQ